MRLHSIVRLFGYSIISLLPSALLAAETGSIVAPGGGVITYTNAAEVTTIPADGSVLLKFTNSTDAASFSFSGMTSARILAVGGGGGGGGICTRSAAGVSPYGGGAGGGAGGFIEVTNLYGAATYTVNVGTGGVAGVGSSSQLAAFPGGNGGPSLITTNGVAMLTAHGGGGGGGQCAGEADESGVVGSGGGGSFYPGSGGEQRDGGKGTAGQGHDGGLGDKAMIGAGGGGAGAVGQSSTEGGQGGDGRKSDITGESEWYAGGGGGGNIDKTITGSTTGIAGGQGGGGQGGRGRSPAEGGQAKAGDPMTGGGGGGAGNNDVNAAGAGGSGVVYVRVLGSVTGGLQKPTDRQFEYKTDDETHQPKTHRPVDPSPFIEIVEGSNDPVSDVGIYTVKAKPIEGLTWADDGKDDPVTVTMVIYEQGAKAETVKLMGVDISFAGAFTNYWLYNETTKTNDLVIGYSKVGAFTLPGSSQTRILAVGGGGGGGGICTRSAAGVSPYGGGAGGGAGGFIEVTNLYGAATYTVNVGTGGVAGVGSSSQLAAFPGGNGGPSLITTNGVAMLTAHGGGGGGGQCAGEADESGVVGSGGGGSFYPGSGGEQRDGGKGTAGQGHDGGLGDKAMIGAGGGGAGAVGQSSTEGGQGGDGRISDITGKEKWYAGGGGGGNIDKTITGSTTGIAGGQGGGGQGGRGRSPAEGGQAKAGDPLTGGGGGGAGNNDVNAAGAGGKGVVWIRISSAMNGEFKKPAPTSEYVYDGKEYRAIEPSVFYDIDGQNLGTTAGVYTAWATLKSGKWPDGTTEPATNVMTILKRPVKVTELKIDDWTFGEAPSEPSCTVDPEWAVLSYEWRVKSEELGGWTDWSKVKPQHAGTYELRVRLPDEENYEFAAPVDPVEFTIEKQLITVTDLRIRDWEVGAPATIPHCTVDPAEVIPSYEWRVKNEELGGWKKWDEVKPTELGTYLLRAVPPNFDDFELKGDPPFEFHIVKGLGGSFTDYVEIEIAGYEGGTLTNWPYRVELSEDHPVGFLYERAPAYGEHMAFTDASGDNILPYEVRSWTTNGTSVIYVKIPKIGSEKQKIRLYWNERPGADIPKYDPEAVWTDHDEKEVEKLDPPQPGMSFPTPVSKDGRFVNYWLRLAELDPDFWDAANPPDHPLKSNAVLAYGQTWRVWENLVTGEAVTNVVTTSSPTEIPTTEGGNFRIRYFQGDDLDGEYDSPSTNVEYSVTADMPFDNLKGGAKSLTLSGRVMLANDDWLGGDKPNDSHAVTDQSYWQVREVETNATTHATMTNDVYWVHGGEEHGDYGLAMKNMLPFSSHWLKYREGGAEKTLWRFNDIIIGNMFPSSGALYSTQAGLPWPSTQRGISSYAARGKVGDQMETGNLIFRNKAGAVIYSPYYTNGIGTVYFDAVNNTVVGDMSSHRLVVEVATETKDHLPPSDENAGVAGASKIEDELAKIVDWKPCRILPLFKNGAGAKFEAQTPAEELRLEVTAQGSTNHFYRVCVKINETCPCRFRIRRPAANEAQGYYADNANLLLVDNIVVSYPAMKAEMKPDGMFERKESTKLVLGQENAMTVPFPSVGDSAVRGRGVPVTYVNAVTNVNPEGLIARSTLHYRWRYLDQASSDWDSVELKPGDGFVAREALKLPRTEGDVEFWYENSVNAPYYNYFDYSGLRFDANTQLGLRDKDGNALYTEQITVSTNGYDNPWFVRLRAGRSDLEGFRVIAKTAANVEPQAIEMNLVGNGAWRGYYQTSEAVDGGDGKGLYVRFEARNRQTPGSSGFATNVTFYTLANDLRELMVPAVLEERKNDPSNTWSRVVCDAQTGYILFQISDENLAATVVHADYQDFNKWNDANADDKASAAGTPPFTGTSTDERTGSSSKTLEIKERFGWWHVSQPTNTAYWSEPFFADPAKAKTEMQKKGGQFEAFQPFTENVSPNGFAVGGGQWVPGAYRDYDSGMALQMEGRGAGSLMFVNAPDQPRGLESITFRPRLAQAIEFDDFSYRAGDALALTSYTFFCRGTYDTNERRDFTGNASLSLVAFYKAGEGCYELRVEQEDANLQGAGGDRRATGPGKKQRLTLYRWNYDEATDELVAKDLGNTIIDNEKTLTTSADTGGSAKYGLLFISAKNTGKATEIRAGVSLGVDLIDSTTDPDCRWVGYNDASALRHENGSYGFLSANCPARFRYLHTCAAQDSSTVTTDLNVFKSVDKKTFDIPASDKLTSCKRDIDRKGWSIQKRRAEYVNTNDTAYFGFKQPAISQTVEVYTAPLGSTDFKTLKLSKEITNFGAVEPVTIPIWSLEDCGVKIKTGGTAKGPRNDIVLDDIELRQWRGESFDDKEGQRYFKQIEYGSPTNFVFTQAWICSNETTGAKSVELSARRSFPTVATSIRTPLFDGNDGRGLGLGMFGFSYTNAQENARLLLQVCTNGVDITNLRTASKLVEESVWKTVDTYDFSKPPYSEKRDSGTILHYFGWHAVKGLIRLVVDPKLVASVTNSTDTAKFGSVTVTEAVCRDEPDLDRFAWWGWNLQTTGLGGRLGLWDADRDEKVATGQAFGLNNSVEDDLAEDPKLYTAHLPFLQTPTFATNTVGEVSFKARKYHPEDADCRVTLYGAVDGTKALDDWNGWTPLRYWTITTNLYETCTYKASQGQTYCAFRFVVTGVKDVEKSGQMQPAEPQETPPAEDPVKRVLIDEVTVMETIVARVAFRNVAAFRTWLDNDRAITDIMDIGEQPLVGESWGVQGELVKAQLPEEIDLEGAKVRLWWFAGERPWGFANWKDSPKAQSAWLRPAGDNANVWRSSYATCPDAVVPMSTEAGPVQYMLEVIWHTKDEHRTEQTSYLDVSDWKKPEWYDPVDFNAKYARQGFSAYTILDTVAPGWAWINEVNVYGEYDENAKNTDADYQYVEIIAPAEADLTGWTVRMLESSASSTTVSTNTVATFGDTLAATKSLNMSSGMVFHVVASDKTFKGRKIRKQDGTLDGVWSFENPSTTFDGSEGEINWMNPFAIQLVRPSGIVEHEIVTIGFNYMAGQTRYPEQYSPTNLVNRLNARMPGSDFLYIGDDDGGVPNAISVWDSRGEISNLWDKAMVHTPGRINAYADGRVQKLPADHPTPQGTAILIWAELGEGGHIVQTLGSVTNSSESQLIVLKKGSKEGTNILYRTDRWWDLGVVTTNGVPYADRKSLGGGLWEVNFGKGASNNFTVVANAAVCSRLRDLGVDENNRYTPAIMDWFDKGVGKDGFIWPESSDEVCLADFRDNNFNFVTNLDLTTMYWLDICPTITNQHLVGGMWKAPEPVLAAPRRRLFAANGAVWPGTQSITNRRMSVFLMVTNTNPVASDPTGPHAWRAAYSPYVLRGVDPDHTSWEYGRGDEWDGPTFKISGILMNGLTDKMSSRNWMPLRWFVFKSDSFYQPGCAAPHKPFTAEIEIEDPAEPGTAGYDYWWPWVKEHGGVWPQIFYRWQIDEKQYIYEVEVLKADSTFK